MKKTNNIDYNKKMCNDGLMTKVEKVTHNLRLTDWHSAQVAEELGISLRVARMYLNGERKIPSRLWEKIPAFEYTRDTHLKSRMKKEQRIKELKSYSIKVPCSGLFNG
jgi:hypothetical protein